MAREAELARGHDDDWFDEGGGKPSGAQRERRARMVLGVVLAVLLLSGIALGAFSSHEPEPGPDLTRLRERAQAATRPSPMQAGGNEALLTGLERLVTAMPKPEPVADVVAAPDAASEEVADAVVAVEADAGPVAKVDPPKRDPPQEPKEPKEPKTPKEPKEPKVANGLGIPTLEAKVDPKAKPDKPVDDPKLKAPLDQALADAKAHLDGGRWNDAKAAYEKVLVMSPGNTRALLGRGRASLELKQVQPALKDIKAVLEAEPRNPTALLLAGSISQELGQKDQARGFYQRYLDAWPSGRKAAEVKALLERM